MDRDPIDRPREDFSNFDRYGVEHESPTACASCRKKGWRHCPETASDRVEEACLAWVSCTDCGEPTTEIDDAVCLACDEARVEAADDLRRQSAEDAAVDAHLDRVRGI